MDEQKESLIATISWYRDDFYPKDFWTDHCNEIIESVRAAQTEESLEIIERMVDDWFDGPPDMKDSE